MQEFRVSEYQIDIHKFHEIIGFFSWNVSEVRFPHKYSVSIALIEVHTAKLRRYIRRFVFLEDTRGSERNIRGN